MNNDIRKLIDDNWEDIKELIVKKTEAEQKPKTIWDFNTNDRNSYYYIDEVGYLRPDWFDEGYFEIRRDLGNAFLTEEEAEFELERRKVEAILRKYSRPFRGEEQNWYLYYNHNNITDTGVVYEINPGIPLFETKEIALKAMEEVGHGRLKKYWFGVTE